MVDILRKTKAAYGVALRIVRGATMAEKLRGTKVGSLHRRPALSGVGGGRPSRREGPGDLRKIFENSDGKSCILATIAVKFLAF